MSVQLLDGDNHELNDTVQTATSRRSARMRRSASAVSAMRTGSALKLLRRTDRRSSIRCACWILILRTRRTSAMRSTRRMEQSLFLKQRSAPGMRAFFHAASRGSTLSDYTRIAGMNIIMYMMFQSSARRSASAWRRAATIPMKATIPGSTQPISSRAS